MGRRFAPEVEMGREGGNVRFWGPGGGLGVWRWLWRLGRFGVLVFVVHVGRGLGTRVDDDACSGRGDWPWSLSWRYEGGGGVGVLASRRQLDAVVQGI